MIKKIRLGDMLVEQSVISQAQLSTALQKQTDAGIKLGDALVELGYIDESGLLSFLAKQLNLPSLDLSNYPIKPEVIRELPETLARRYKMIPIDRFKKGYLVAMADPTDLVAYDEVSKKLKKEIRVVIAKEHDIQNVIDDVFRKTDEIASLVGELEQEIGSIEIVTDISEQTADAPIKKLLNSIFEDAIQVNASDIHIEPDENCLRIRQRVDGVLQEQVMKGKTIISALILRLKLMAKLNISERRLPQDGRFSVIVKGRKIDVRMSTMPLKSGEACVLRLLDQSLGVKTLGELGLDANHLECFRHFLSAPHGMILVTGPTGSGKSTTLYGGLQEINNYEKKIITVEDPVEYSFERVNQVQVEPQIGLSFSRVLRSALRHDPDVVMVGEIRDEETASMALRAAMTGHLVLSTLHTNDALTSPMRLTDMGVEPYLVASSLKLVIAQRLIRRVCKRCGQKYAATGTELKWIEKLIEAKVPNIQFVKGEGCSHCGMSGYKGRVGVFEFLQVNHKMAEALRNNDINGFIEYARGSTMYRPLTLHALDYACKGITTISEVLRLAVELDEDRAQY